MHNRREPPGWRPSETNRRGFAGRSESVVQPEQKPARLVLDDGSVYEGISFGAGIPAGGEVVFTTGMTGYPQYLTDPSFRGQIIVSTYPLVGNYGVPSMTLDRFGIPVGFESERIQARALVVAEACAEPSHFASGTTLSRWLESQGVPGIQGVDTRALTKHLRSRGTMNGRLLVGGTGPEDEGHGTGGDETSFHPVADVSPREVRIYEPDPGQAGAPVTIVLVDCGAKANILRCLLARGARVVRVPWNHDLEGIRYDGLFLSNGPGDPKACGRTIATVRRALRGDRPVFGICLGNQILALAAGADTYKLPYGHRGQNQPCIEEGSERCFITSQNHGYAVRGNTMPPGWEVWFRNANDDTIEGIRTADNLFSAVQFHPEGCPGPRDTEYLIDRFVERAAGRGR